MTQKKRIEVMKGTKKHEINSKSSECGYIFI